MLSPEKQKRQAPKMGSKLDKKGYPFIEKMNIADIVKENFADGKVKGKSHPGRVKRAGASCKGSVSRLRKKAKNQSGERAKMYPLVCPT